MINELDAAQNTIYGWPIFLMIVIAFVLNFIIARKLTIALINQGFLNHKSTNPREIDTFEKCILAWFIPVVGVASIVMLLITHSVIRIFKRTRTRLFLKHV